MLRNNKKAPGDHPDAMRELFDFLTRPLYRKAGRLSTGLEKNGRDSLEKTKEGAGWGSGKGNGGDGKTDAGEAGDKTDAGEAGDRDVGPAVEEGTAG